MSVSCGVVRVCGCRVVSCAVRVSCAMAGESHHKGGEAGVLGEEVQHAGDVVLAELVHRNSALDPLDLAALDQKHRCAPHKQKKRVKKVNTIDLTVNNKEFINRVVNE